MKRRPRTPESPSDSSLASPPDRGDGPRCADAPAPKTRLLLSLFLVFHLAAVTTSFFSVVEPSETQSRLLAAIQPYLRATRFGVDDRPVYLAHADQSEQPMRLQVADTLDPSDDDWRTIEPQGVPGLASWDRYHRWLATAVLLVESDQPGLVAEWLLGFVASEPEIRSVRILVLPTDLVAVSEDEEAVYVARVARRGDQISLVHVPPAGQSAFAVPQSGGEDSGGEAPGGENP